MQKKKIMIVEDDPECLEELREMLVSVGYDVKAISDSTLAFDTVNKIRPDAILLDLKMPNKSGFQVADELKRFSGLENIPIIAMTAFFTESEHALLMNICGIKKCLKKPLDPKEVIEQIETALVNKQPRHE